MVLGRLLCVLRIGRHLSTIQKILYQFFDELLLFARRRTAIRQKLHALTGSDVPKVPGGTLTAGAAPFEIGTLDNQSCHSSSFSHALCTYFSRKIQPIACSFVYCGSVFGHLRGGAVSARFFARKASTRHFSACQVYGAKSHTAAHRPEHRLICRIAGYSHLSIPSSSPLSK